MKRRKQFKAQHPSTALVLRRSIVNLFVSLIKWLVMASCCPAHLVHDCSTFPRHTNYTGNVCIVSEARHGLVCRRLTLVQSLVGVFPVDVAEAALELITKPLSEFRPGLLGADNTLHHSQALQIR